MGRAFVYLRGRSLTDDLVDLLIETIHHIGARAARKVERELLDDLRRVSGKQKLLFQVADASLDQPDGLVRDVVFPVVGEQTLRDLVKEWKATGPTYRTTLRTIIRNSYKGHYRRMVPEILERLEFRSNNEHHRPVIEALELLKRFAGSKAHGFPPKETVPVDGVVRGLWREAVIETEADGRSCVNRITYEICVLEALRDRLRCKEIWVVGADRYRNPDDDLPSDFDAQREPYYQALDLPLDAGQFIAKLQNEMRLALQTLDDGLPSNPLVRITPKKGGQITVTPFEPQPEPPNLTAIKTEITSTWPMTSLLGMVKEADLRLNFTDALKSPTAYESLDRSVLRPRLLLCLHGIGTNAGLQRMAGLHSGVTQKDLAYVRGRYLTVEALRRAVSIVTNGTLRVRNPAIWGDGTTACASDSKHFGAWDQNLTTQWHVRYGGRGVMIYWHVERNSLCIHSQLKSPSSSEVASMIEGVVHHCTEMEIDRQYVDLHGQSTVAFAFCHLLGFQLMPRLKRINVQKLYRPDVGQPDAYRNLQLVLTKPIDWEIIRQQYDQMVGRQVCTQHCGPLVSSPRHIPPGYALWCRVTGPAAWRCRRRAGSGEAGGQIDRGKPSYHNRSAPKPSRLGLSRRARHYLQPPVCQNLDYVGRSARSRPQKPARPSRTRLPINRLPRAIQSMPSASQICPHSSSEALVSPPWISQQPRTSASAASSGRISTRGDPGVAAAAAAANARVQAWYASGKTIGSLPSAATPATKAERNSGNRRGCKVMVVISRPPIKRTPLSAADSGRMRHSVSTKGRHSRISQFSQLAE